MCELYATIINGGIAIVKEEFFDENEMTMSCGHKGKYRNRYGCSQCFQEDQERRQEARNKWKPEPNRFSKDDDTLINALESKKIRDQNEKKGRLKIVLFIVGSIAIIGVLWYFFSDGVQLRLNSGRWIWIVLLGLLVLIGALFGFYKYWTNRWHRNRYDRTYSYENDKINR